MKATKTRNNVYADIGVRDPEEMLLKAKLAAEMGELIRRRKLTQTEAAIITGIPQPKLSEILRGRFRGVSEAKLMSSLSKLGASVRIVVRYGREKAVEHQLAVA